MLWSDIGIKWGWLGKIMANGESGQIFPGKQNDEISFL